MAGGYLPWLGIPTLAGGTYLGLDGYLPWLGGYLPWPGVPTLAGGVPTLAGGYLPWLGGTYLGQVTPRVWTDKQTETTTFPHATDAGGNKK